MDMSRYRKVIAAIAAAVVEIVAVWQGAPHWAITTAAVAGAVLVYAVPNRSMEQALGDALAKARAQRDEAVREVGRQIAERSHDQLRQAAREREAGR